MSPSKPHSSYFGSIIFLLILVSVTLFAISSRQWIIDNIQAQNYKPTGAAEDIRTHLKLTDLGTFYFNASQTVVQSAQPFNTSCNQKKEINSPILGCYVGQQIHIYGITNQKLNGIEEVTAAHELLHAAYDRMDGKEKSQVNFLLENEYQKVKTTDIEERMNYYRTKEPGEELNELHSILGTEVQSLSPELERHYQKYFGDRLVITSYYQAYSSVFHTALDNLNKLSEEINSRTAAVNGRIQTYNALVKTYENDVDNFNAKSDKQNGFSSQVAFNEARAELVARRAAIDSELSSIKAEIAAIDALRKNYNNLASDYNDLNQSINSSLAPAPSL